MRLKAQASLLKPVEVDAKNIPDLVPVIAVLACYAKGTSHIFGAQRLRLKESDRLESLYLELTKMGAQISMKNDGLIIEGRFTTYTAQSLTHTTTTESPWHAQSPL